MANFMREAIRQSFLKLLNVKPFSKITVKDVTDDCGISRNSFYYHFQDLPSLLEEIVREETDAIMARYPNVDTLEECLTVASEFVLANKKAAYHIYRSVNRDMFEQYLWKVCAHAVQTFLRPLFSSYGVSQSDRRIIERYYRCTVFGQISDWLANDMREDLAADGLRLCVLKKGMLEELLRRSAAT